MTDPLQLEGVVSPLEDLRFSSKPTDLSGAFTQLEAGTYAVTSSDPAVIDNGVVDKDGEAQPDGSFLYSALCSTKSKNVGDSCILSITGDGDVGAGQDTIEVQYKATIVHANAANLGLLIERVPKPAPAA
jgi:hypothetical protein